ncbi:hypothetical protein [Sinorhizobium sp. BG8]|uniref:hypothetical protein n=1 Tax=Sinorhizobium sp. BG8 TaxID=2613773 RepID=UPI00193E0610|nr:hypothetical protein [Sinorhizobium sp. BG8]QRM55123.1 hypothetical protein F3Y30_11710 [Sinorhizobium sp. BG8]
MHNAPYETRNIRHDMAETMLRIGHGCTADDLIGEGFTGRQVELHGPAARDLANARAIRRS